MKCNDDQNYNHLTYKNNYDSVPIKSFIMSHSAKNEIKQRHPQKIKIGIEAWLQSEDLSRILFKRIEFITLQLKHASPITF